MVIGIDFDGTIVEDRYPEIGRERLFALILSSTALTFLYC